MKKIVYLIVTFTLIQLSFAQTYEEVGKQVGVGDHFALDTREMSGGLVVFDYDNDGYEDIFVTGGLLNHSALFKNMKNGTFKNVYASSGIVISVHDQTMGAAAADLDNDGDKDLVVTTFERADPYLFENRDGKFYNITSIAGLEAKIWNTAVSFIDFDLDGDLDMYFSSYVGGNGDCDRNFFYENLGNMKFKEIAEELGVADKGCSLASTFSDYDNDGDFDLLVANDFGLTVQSNKIFENMYPERKFVDVSENSGFNARIFGMGIEGGDFDEDGDMDYYTTNIGPNKFYVNNGNKTMTERGVEFGLDNKYKKGTDSLATSWGIHWYDYNHDSYLDLFVSNGNVVLTDSLMSFMDPNLLYRNNGDNTFTEVGEMEGIADIKKGRGIGLIDFDNDGDMDIVQSVVTGKYGAKSETADDRVNFFKSNASENGNHWIQFHLKGTTDNRDAIGSKIAIYFNGRRLIAESPSGGSSYMAQRTGIIHFGLGNATSIDRVEVTFPNGEVEVKNNLSVDQRYNITQTYRTSAHIDLCYGERYGNKFKVYKDTVVIENYKTSDDVDSIVTVNISVYDEIKVNEYLDLCYGDEFKEISWKNNGTTNEVLRSYLGCDSTIVYNINVLPAVETQIDTSVCYGGLFGKTRITRDRIISQEIENPNGCDSIMVYNITVNDGPKFSETFEVCQGEMYRDVLIVSDTILFNSFKTSSGCDSIYEEQIVMLPYGMRDTVVNIYSDEMYEGKYYETDTTLYKNLGIKSINGCDSLLAVMINVTQSSVSFDYSNSLGLNVYPNPAESYIDISYNQPVATKVTIEIYSGLGQKIATIFDGISKQGENNLIWKFENKNLPTGVYMLRLIDKEKFITKKVVIK